MPKNRTGKHLAHPGPAAHARHRKPASRTEGPAAPPAPGPTLEAQPAAHGKAPAKAEERVAGKRHAKRAKAPIEHRFRYCLAQTAVLVGIVALTAVSAFSEPPASPEPASEPAPTAEAGEATLLAPNEEEQLEPAFAEYEALRPADLSLIPETDGVVGFSLAEPRSANMPSATASELTELKLELSAFERDGDAVAFLIMDLETGRGLAYNIDEDIFGASSFKAACCVFFAEEYIDAGKRTLESAESDLRDIIVYSDNDRYAALYESVSRPQFASWLAGLGADESLTSNLSIYPEYSVRDMSRIWFEASTYMEGGTPAAEALDDYFSSTEMSFLRAALIRETDAGDALPAATVWNKAGWQEYTGDPTLRTAMADAGIIEATDGRKYLMCFMTDMPWSEQNEKHVQNLLSSVYDMREEL